MRFFVCEVVLGDGSPNKWGAFFSTVPFQQDFFVDDSFDLVYTGDDSFDGNYFDFRFGLKSTWFFSPISV